MTAAVEIAGQVILKQGIASSFRPRRYYTIPQETREAILEDVSQLLDFFLIEFQRILFAENVVHTVAVCDCVTCMMDFVDDTDGFLGLHCRLFWLLARSFRSALGSGCYRRDCGLPRTSRLHHQPRDH